MSQSRVLITGASGFVGFHLIEAALKEGFEVIAAIRTGSQVQHLQDYHLEYVQLNFSDEAVLKQQLQQLRIDYIIHAAGATKAVDQQAYNAVNAECTLKLAKAAATLGSLKKMVFLSSLAAVGPVPFGKEIAADKALEPVTAYGRSKKLAEEYLQNIDLPWITLRPTAVYGPREKDIFILVKSVCQGFEPYIGRGRQQLSFVYVKDLAAVTMQALQSSVVKKTYNISDGQQYDRYRLANLIKQVMGKKTLRMHLPLALVKLLALTMEKWSAISKKTPTLNLEKLNELTAESWACSIEDAVKDLSFTPRYPLEKGVIETMQWYKDHRWI